MCIKSDFFFFFFLIVYSFSFHLHAPSSIMSLAMRWRWLVRAMRFILPRFGAQYPLRKECDDRKCDLFVLEVWEECVRCSPLIVPLLYEKRDIY